MPKFEIGLVMLGAFTAEAAGRITQGSYSWASATVYLVIGLAWLGAGLWQNRQTT